MNKESKKISCSHFGTCSGCLYHSCETAPEIFSQAIQFFQKHTIDLSLVQGSVHGWRIRAKLAVRKQQKRTEIGLFQKNSHHVVSIPFCKTHHPKINEAVHIFSQAFMQSSLSSYQEKNHTGALRYIQCVVERRTKKVQLSVVLNAYEKDLESWKQFLQELFQAHPIWHSCWINVHRSKTNTIFSKEWIHVIGPEYILEDVLGVSIPFGPSHFGQANLDMFEKLLLDLQGHILSAQRMVELYAGIGVIGLTLAKHAETLILCEEEKSCEKYFQKAKESLPQELQHKFTFFSGKSESASHLLEGADICIVDPPRKGVEKTLLQTIVQTQSIQKLVYISCDFHSLERDLTLILAHPEWRIEHAKSYLFFPGTNHIETVVILKNLGEWI